MLEAKAIDVGLAQFAAELPDLQRGFASVIARIKASAVDRGMLRSGPTVGQCNDAILREYKTRAARLWHLLRELLPANAVGDPEDPARLHDVVARAVDESSNDLVAQYEEVGRLMAAAVPMPSLEDMRGEALAQVNAEIDADLLKLSMAVAASSSVSAGAPARDGLTIFLGSSGAAKSQAKAVAAALTRPGLTFLPWWDAFTPGNTLLQELDVIREKVDGALLLFSPESETTIRGNQVKIPNLNVLFEFGYFYGHFGKARVGMLQYGEFYLPSDFGGYIHITGSKFFKRSAVVQVGKRTTNEFNRWVAGL